MPFPLSRRAKIVCNPASDAALLMGDISERLREAGCEDVQLAGDRVYFAGPKGKDRRQLLRLIDEGEVKISTKDGRLVVSYSLRFKGLLILTAAFALLGLGLLHPAAFGLSSFSSFLFLVSGSWVLGQVVAYIQAADGFARLVKHALKADRDGARGKNLC